MRTVVAYVDGRPIWSENVPAYGGSIRFGGTLSFSGPGSVELARIAGARANARLRKNEALRETRAKAKADVA